MPIVSVELAKWNLFSLSGFINKLSNIFTKEGITKLKYVLKVSMVTFLALIL